MRRLRRRVLGSGAELDSARLYRSLWTGSRFPRTPHCYSIQSSRCALSRSAAAGNVRNAERMSHVAEKTWLTTRCCQATVSLGKPVTRAARLDHEGSDKRRAAGDERAVVVATIAKSRRSVAERMYIPRRPQLRLPPLLLPNGAVSCRTLCRSARRPGSAVVVGYCPGSCPTCRAATRSTTGRGTGATVCSSACCCLHVPLLIGLALVLGHSTVQATQAVIAPLACLVLGHLVSHRRWASFFVTGGLVFCSIALVCSPAAASRRTSTSSSSSASSRSIRTGYRSCGTSCSPRSATASARSGWAGLIFNHPAAQATRGCGRSIHGVAVLFACIGMVFFWRVTEDAQDEKDRAEPPAVTDGRRSAAGSSPPRC